MPFYPIVLEFIQKAKEDLKGYCTGLEESVCESKLREEFAESFKDFSINVDPFLDYPLYALDGNDTWINHDDKPTFEAEVQFSLIKKDMVKGSVCPSEVSDPIQTLNEQIITDSSNGRWWPYSAIVGKFYPGSDSTRSGMLSYDTNHATLGLFNYGYKFDEDNYVFKNSDPSFSTSPDYGCEGTQDKKSNSLYSGKFNCVYGQKYTTDEINELELFMIRNPGFQKEELYFIEPEIPYRTSHIKEDPLYKQGGQFFNPQVDKYGTPLNLKEQNIDHSKTIISKLVEWSK